MHTPIREMIPALMTRESPGSREEEVPSHKTIMSSLGDMIALAAESRLMQSPYMELHRATCEWVQGVLVLRGRVSRYYLKQVAQSLVGQVPGVEKIDNQIRILPFPNYVKQKRGS